MVPELHRALRIKTAETDRSISDLISDAVKSALAEDAEDLQAIGGGSKVSRFILAVRHGIDVHVGEKEPSGVALLVHPRDRLL